MNFNRIATVWAITLVALAVVASTLPSFFRFIEARPGTVPPDPLIAHLAPMDLSVPVFVVLYGSILLAVLSIAGKPSVLLRALQAYLVLLLLRMISMFTFTLEPPADLIDLVDPVTQLFYPDDRPFRKDLFFSGHTATLALLAFAVTGPRIRAVLWTATFLVGAAVILQHVHWTVDVVVAPLFAWLAWRIAGSTVRITAAIPLAGKVLDVDAAGDAFGENVRQ
jgi:hypothetical protein